jgi:hypothetical protein
MKALHGSTRRIVLALALVLAAGCASSGAKQDPPLPPQLSLEGRYEGSLTVEGNFLPATLTVEHAGETIRLRLSVPQIGVMTEGEGVASAEGFSARLPYALSCPGEARLEGAANSEEAGLVLAGRITATDCDSTLGGTFRFTRRVS